jgi:hypothetical protein
MNLERIPDILNRNPPATEEQIAGLSRTLGLDLPSEYRQLLRTANGIHADLVCFYSTAEVPERSGTHEVGRYAPGYILIGSANDFPILLRAGETSPVYETGWGAMSEDRMREIAPNLAAWVEAGCPLPDDEE